MATYLKCKINESTTASFEGRTSAEKPYLAIQTGAQSTQRIYYPLTTDSAAAGSEKLVMQVTSTAGGQTVTKSLYIMKSQRTTTTTVSDYVTSTSRSATAYDPIGRHAYSESVVTYSTGEITQHHYKFSHVRMTATYLAPCFSALYSNSRFEVQTDFDLIASTTASNLGFWISHYANVTSLSTWNRVYTYRMWCSGSTVIDEVYQQVSSLYNPQCNYSIAVGAPISNAQYRITADKSLMLPSTSRSSQLFGGTVTYGNAGAYGTSRGNINKLTITQMYTNDKFCYTEGLDPSDDMNASKKVVLVHVPPQESLFYTTRVRDGDYVYNYEWYAYSKMLPSPRVSNSSDYYVSYTETFSITKYDMYTTSTVSTTY